MYIYIYIYLHESIEGGPKKPKSQKAKKPKNQNSKKKKGAAIEAEVQKRTVTEMHQICL